MALGIEHPLLGTIALEECAGVPEQEVTIGVLDLGGDKLVTAVWCNSRWQSRDGQPVTKPILKCYRMRRADGTPLF